MRLPITQKKLEEWAGARVFREGQNLFAGGRVLSLDYEPPQVEGTLAYGQRALRCRFLLPAEGGIESQCPCRDNTERGILCAHVVALALHLIRRHTDPDYARKRLEEVRRAQRLAAADTFQQRGRRGQTGARQAAVRLALAPDWTAQLPAGPVPVAVYFELDGRLAPAGELPRDCPLVLSNADENLLFVLEDMAGGAPPSRMELAAGDFMNLLALHRDRPLGGVGDAAAYTVQQSPMQSRVRMTMTPATGELTLTLETPLPFAEPDAPVHYVLAAKQGWVCSAGHFWPLANLLPLPFHALYLQPIRIEHPSVLRFLQTELPLLDAHVPVDSDISAELFTEAPGTPQFHLEVRGSPASLAARLYAQYDAVTLVAGQADAAGQFALPDPDDVFRFTVRNPAAEAGGLALAAEAGFQGAQGAGLSAIIGCREVLRFLGAYWPRLRRLGWRVTFEGRIKQWLEEAEFAAPVVRVAEAPQGAFEVGLEYDVGGSLLAPAVVQRAMLRGESHCEFEGRTILLDADAIAATQRVLADCVARDARTPGRFQIDRIQAPYIEATLGALEGVDLEAPPDWLRRARAANRSLPLEPVAVAPPLGGWLRPYQQEGVNWLRFLEGNGLGGILADEMGLGKTIQALAWLRLARVRAEVRGRPCLVVCPTSLVDNWLAEAAHFTPELKTLRLAGSERHAAWEQVPDADLAVTSYALLRRDSQRYAAFEFAAVILDEAQHIKNRATQNARAARQLRAAHRLVLTGTPIENSVADLWSIMEFLMPGYLGSAELFRARYEQPIRGGGIEGAQAQDRLRRRLQPFLLRRLKRTVARDLPEKIERYAACDFNAEQWAVYREYLAAARGELTDMVARQGFQRTRMHILKALLRLRQICCHLDLLRLPGLKPGQPSAKLELCFELLDEAFDGGHRVLLFSQFTSMLGILRRELESRGVPYCYLDGATRDRAAVVRSFNTDRQIPIFLISLKAGGTGLNLTGADMVIHYDPWWNPAVEDQATDRAHRIGQKNTVYCVKLLTRNSIEEKVVALQRRKQEIIGATLAAGGDFSGALSWDDIRELLEG